MQYEFLITFAILIIYKAMKNITILLLFFSIIFLSCEEAVLSIPNSQLGSGFEVSFDGKEFFTESVDYTSDGTNIFINAIKPETNEIFTIKIPDFGIGTFDLEGTTNIATYIKNDPTSADIWSTFDAASSEGKVVFTKIDDVNNTVSGTFNFTAENLSSGARKEFTLGRFSDVSKNVLPVSNDDFSAKIEGKEYVDISLFGSLVSIGSSELIMISANRSLTETIGISLESDISIGTYSFGSFISQSYPTGQYSLNGSTYVADGEIIITQHDTANKNISGTFEFVASPITSATPNFNITEGAFSVSY